MKTIMILGVLALGISLGAAQTDSKAAAHYKKDCAKCHGADGKGLTTMGRKMGAKDYTDAGVQKSLKDEEMFKAVKEGLKRDGKTLMRPYDKLSDEEIKDLVAYMRAFAKK